VVFTETSALMSAARLIPSAVRRMRFEMRLRTFTGSCLLRDDAVSVFGFRVEARRNKKLGV
jgi:hypothetical protein